MENFEEPKSIAPMNNSVIKQTAAIDGFLAKRQEFIKKVSAICVEGKDYHIIQGKKSLAKGGAEKIASIFAWQAKFTKDEEALQMLGDIQGLVAFKCVLENKSKFVGEGRGAASVAKNGGDPNKTLKMAQKSAYIDAVIRASGLSDFFTQDLEDMPSESISNAQTDAPKTLAPTEKQIAFMKSLCQQKGYTKEDIIDQGFTKIDRNTAKELIDWLIKAPTRITPNGDAIMGREELTPERAKMIDDIKY